MKPLQLLRFQVVLDPRRTPFDITDQDILEVHQMLPDLISQVLALRNDRRMAARDTLVQVFAGHARLTPGDIAQARMEGRARSAVLEGTDWYTRRQIAVLAQLGPGNPGATVSRWKTQGRIFALCRGRRDLYPAYAFGPDFKPRPVVKAILSELGDRGSEWLAAWFESTSRYLGGRRPRELLASAPHRVLAAARDEVGSWERVS